MKTAVFITFVFIHMFYMIFSSLPEFGGNRTKDYESIKDKSQTVTFVAVPHNFIWVPDVQYQQPDVNDPYSNLSLFPVRFHMIETGIEQFPLQSFKKFLKAPFKWMRLVIL